MAVPIRPKRSETPGAVPTAGALATGELAINIPDKKLFVKKADGTVADVTPSSTGGGVAATQQETDTGTATDKFVSPATLAGHSNRKRKTEGTLGDGTNSTFTITHGFGTRAVLIQIYRNSGQYDDVTASTARPTTNTVTVTFGFVPTAGQFAYVIMG